jgi:peptidoglycan/LPS O-acetylase OafA/YrhL
MGLRIVSEKLESSGESSVALDGYVDRLRKYIPTEAVTFWLTVSGMIQSAGEAIPRVGLLWLFFVIGLVFAFAWTHRRTRVPQKPTAWTQIGVSTGAFVVWVFATGGPLATSLPFYQPLYGSLLLITYTAAVAFVVPPEN